MASPYVGITGDMVKRGRAYLRDKGITVDRTEGLQNLSRDSSTLYPRWCSNWPAQPNSKNKEKVMSPLGALISLGLAGWSTIFLGFRKHWIRRRDIFEYAMNQLLAGCESERAAIIAGGEYFSDEELLEIISQQMEMTDCVADTDKWRLAFLLSLEASNDNDENKINRLQEIYADFDYPEDMASCSIYSQDGLDPLVAMSQVVKRLKERFLLR